MPRIFICYRRDDAAASAGRMFDRLTERFGRDHVFMDVDTIRPGEDYTVRIDEFVGGCDTFVAVVGRGWLAPGASGKRRLDDPDDYVRQEIEAALARDIQVLPVLVEGGAMPGPEDLPPSLAPFARRQAVEVSQSRFNHDVGRLADAIEGATTAEPPGARPPLWKRPLAWVGTAASLAAIAIALAIGLGGGEADDSSQSTTAGLEPGRIVALAVFDAWRANELYTLDDRQISTAAFDALREMPIDPISPRSAGSDDCHGDPDDLECGFFYPGIGIHLNFSVLRYPDGLRVTQIRCFISDTGEELPLDECVGKVRES